MTTRLLFTILVTASAVSCRASVQADANISAKTDPGEEADFDKPLLTPQQDNDLGAEGGPLDYALLGARHDLSFAGDTDAVCQCLAAAVGQPNDPKFVWEAEVPKTNPNTQWVVALSSQQVACPEAKPGSLGGSYQGYRVEGEDIVVMVEERLPGTPLTSGAIVPQPTQAGSIYLTPAGEAPYGRGTDGGPRCKLATGIRPAAAGPLATPPDLSSRPTKARPRAAATLGRTDASEDAE